MPDQNVEKKISCVIPVYNEATRVLNVIKAVQASTVVDELIVVDDGSSDNTAEVLSKVQGINFISYKPNGGKSHAIKVGFKATKNDYVMMIDSDLEGLNGQCIDELAMPVVNGSADISISLRKNSLGIYKFFGLDFISGERVFKKDLIPDLEVLEKLTGFGLESYMNQIIIEKKLRIKVVYWPTVESPRKAVKVGWFKGMWGDIKMSGEIIKLLGLFGVVRVFRSMKRLMV